MNTNPDKKTSTSTNPLALLLLDLFLHTHFCRLFDSFFFGIFPHVPCPVLSLRRDKPSELGSVRPPQLYHPPGATPCTLPRSAGSELSPVAADHHRGPCIRDALLTLAATTVSVLSILLAPTTAALCPHPRQPLLARPWLLICRLHLCRMPLP
jgi:hypothetical protein